MWAGHFATSVNVKIIVTRLHSSRMRTARALTVDQGVSALGGVCSRGVSAPGGVCSWGGGGVCSRGRV